MNRTFNFVGLVKKGDSSIYGAKGSKTRLVQSDEGFLSLLRIQLIFLMVIQSLSGIMSVLRSSRVDLGLLELLKGIFKSIVLQNLQRALFRSCPACPDSLDPFVRLLFLSAVLFCIVENLHHESYGPESSSIRLQRPEAE